jgi:hypothetical protein
MKIREIISENFADGKNPQDKGDSARHGIPKKASISSLRKIAKQGGRKGQLAHWQANMRSGKAKTEEVDAQESAAWRRKEGKSKEGGLNAKGVASYRRENPGSKLQTAVTTKPSKLKAGSKDAKRRKSFCARMGGVEGPMKKDNGEPTRKALALRKWNC